MSVEESHVDESLVDEERVSEVSGQEEEEEAEESGVEGQDAEADAEAEAENEAAKSGEFSGNYNARDVNDQIFEELHMNHATVAEVQNIWASFLNSVENREAAGEAIYAALFDAAPSLQSLFKTPRAVMAMRFMNGLSNIISQLGDPKALKIVVETLGFQHLDLEVTVPRVVIFREAIVDLLAMEIGSHFTKKARDGWCTFLNYVGGSYIYVRVKYAERLKIMASSWAQANTRKADEVEGAEEGSGDGADGADGGGADITIAGAVNGQTDELKAKKKSAKKGSSFFGSKKSSSAGSGANSSGGERDSKGGGFQNTSVPKTYNDMFMFNAAVMGFGGKTWMKEVLDSFDTIVTNVANSYRLQEECDVLSLRMAKYKSEINLPEYKSVMLASLRSLVKDWGSLHEISWSWLWENVERMLQSLMGKPAVQEMALSNFFAGLDENALGFIRREVYSKFFALAPAGQDYFKQSTTRLHFIADKLVVMTLDMYKEPKRMVEDISALGLRHVGYGIPTDLFGPFVTACVQVVRMLTDDDKAEESFRWSLGLISRILTRVINEGSTIVMKAINANSGKQLRKALSCAPRGRRALWMLNIQVGTQSISPLLWAIETGSLDAARGIIVDLLTIRADRDRYYYGMDIMFERHPDIIKRLCQDAPALVPTLLDGLIWRSRVTENGQRRVNYYVKQLVVDEEGHFSKATEWITDNQDPKLVCHAVVALVTDTVWSRIAFRSFLYGKTWFVFTLLVFIASQSVLTRVSPDEETGVVPMWSRGLMFGCRCFIYLVSMGQWLIFHIRTIFKDIRAKAFVRVWKVPVPEYLCNWQDVISLCLTGILMIMLCLEPTLRCMSSSDEDTRYSTHCPESSTELVFAYSIFSTGAMLMYFLLLSDLSVFSTRVSAFALVCGRVLSEVMLFLFGLLFFVAAFACAIAALDQDHPQFNSIDAAGLRLIKITFSMYSGEHYDSLLDYPALLFTVFVYVVVTVIFLLNLLIAQLICAYQATYQDMLGYARLNRGKIVTETMVGVAKNRWDRFVDSLRLDERCEFGEGDIGLAGGIQVFEPANANITTVDMIRRFGGSTSPAAQWPEEEGGANEDVDRFDHLEKMIEKAMKRMSSSKGGKRGGGSSSGAGASSAMLSSSQDGSVNEGSVSE